MSNKNVYVEKLKAQLDVWAADLDKLEARAKIAGADARVELERQIAELRKNQDVAKAKLQDIEDSSEDAWNDLKDSVENAWNRLRDGLEDAASRFK